MIATGLFSIVYQQSAHDRSELWYRRVLNLPPRIDLPVRAGFNLGRLTTTWRPASGPGGIRSMVTVWGIVDLDDEYQGLLDLGASPHTPLTEIRDGYFQAVLLDPSGEPLELNLIALASAEQAVGQDPLDSAERTALVRALAWRKGHGPDRLADLFLKREQVALLDDPEYQKWVLEHNIPAGMYPFLPARTLYFDFLYLKALRENVPQIVALGSGFDTRVLRLRDSRASTRVFELDMPDLLERKTDCLAGAGLDLPSELTLVPLDFHTHDLGRTLSDAGFDAQRPALFLGEGVTYYMKARTMDAILDFIGRRAARGSEAAFDYIFSPDLKPAQPVARSGDAPRRAGGPEGKGRGIEIIEHHFAGELVQWFLNARRLKPFGEAPSGYAVLRFRVN